VRWGRSQVAERKPPGYWTRDRILKAARLCMTMAKFRRKHGSAYNVARTLGLHSELHKLFGISKHKPRGYWSESRLRAEAAQHARFADFFNVIGKSGYEAMRKLGLLHDLTSHMPKQIGREQIWTTESLQAEAAKYQDRVDFLNQSTRAYKVAHKRGLLDTICAHMRPKWESRRTWTPERIADEAAKFATRSAFMRQAGSAYGAAVKLGILGTVCCHMQPSFVRQWTDAKIHAEAAKYTKVIDFYRGSMNAYEAAQRWGIFDRVCAHMLPRKKPTGYWTEATIRAAAAQYRTRSAFYDGNTGAATAAKRLGIYEVVCAHMPKSAWQPPPQVPLIWSRERIFEVARKYSQLGDFQRNHGSAYNAARKQGLLLELRSFLAARRPPGYWTAERVMAEAAKYSTRSAFQKSSGAAHGAAKTLNIYESVCAHMGRAHTPTAISRSIPAVIRQQIATRFIAAIVRLIERGASPVTVAAALERLPFEQRQRVVHVIQMTARSALSRLAIEENHQYVLATARQGRRTEQHAPAP
jgi:hypothetical protein